MTPELMGVKEWREAPQNAMPHSQHGRPGAASNQTVGDAKKKRWEQATPVSGESEPSTDSPSRFCAR